MPIQATRALLRAALGGDLDRVPTAVDPAFGLRVPRSCPDVDPALLDPRATWADQAAYDQAAWDLAARFERNFAQFAPFVGSEVQAAGIRAAA
jgi:phosphoenolpyruvate carboxykinase (ATP)